jgi:predicted TIM-barrel fold metal-dependent hydrolase
MKIIDVHSHYVTPYYRSVMEREGRLGGDLVPIPQWSLESFVEAMDVADIDAVVLSAISPNQSYGDRAIASELTRELNETGAEYVHTHPGRLCYVAALPLPHVEDSLEEIRVAFDVLGAAGVRLFSNSCGVYPGDPSTEAVFAELGRRGAVCVLHPTRPAWLPEHTLSSLTVPLYEFFPETSRAVINLILSGTLTRYPDLKIVVPHNGALIIPLLERIQALYTRLLPTHPELEVVDFLAEARKLYFDIAGDPLPRQFNTLLTFAYEDHILYGTDYPFASPENLRALRRTLMEQPETSRHNEKLFYANAKALFPTLA